MTTQTTTPPDIKVTCANCEACCCRSEVLLITDTGVPDNFIAMDKWGGMSMARLEDGWCAALDRNTLLCTIYEKRPQICRELEMGEDECISIRTATLLAKSAIKNDKTDLNSL